MESPERHGDADDATVTSLSKSFDECFEKLEKMHQTQNARLDEITKRSEEQFTYITQMLSSITEGKLKYTEPDEADEKSARTSVESPQQPGPSRAGVSAEHSYQRQVKQRARTSVECPKRKRQVSDSDRSSCTTQGHMAVVMKRRILRNLRCIMIKIVLMKILDYCVAVKLRIGLRQRKKKEIMFLMKLNKSIL